MAEKDGHLAYSLKNLNNLHPKIWTTG